jgi:hypothetical protein
MTVEHNAGAHPELQRWMRATRLSPTAGLEACHDDPAVVEARGRIKRYAPAAAQHLHELVSTAS